MNTIVQFLSKLRSLNVSLSLDGDRLVCKAPNGALTPELKTELIARKEEVVQFLSSARAVNPRVGRYYGVRSNGGQLSHAQQRLWFLDQMEPGSPVYNVALAVRMSGRLDREALERSLREILHRHEVMRSSFVTEDGVPSARVESADGFAMSYADLCGVQEHEEDARVIAEVSRPFDLMKGPLFRATLFQIAPKDYLLTIVMHHIIADGWSLGLFMKELGALYTAFAAGMPSPLAPLEYQYADYVVWEQKSQESIAAPLFPYWKQRLGGALPVLELPVDKVRPPIQTFRGRRSKMRIPRPLLQELRSLSHKHEATLFMTLLATFKTLLFRYTGLADMIVGTPNAGRKRDEFASLIGLFVNNLVLRTDLSGNPKFTDLLSQIREISIQAYVHQDVPFDRLVQALHPTRDLSHSPLFQVMFALQNFQFPDLHLPELQLAMVDLEVGTARYDLTVEIYEKPEGHDCYFEFNVDLFDEATIRRMQEHYLTLLRGVIANPESRIGELPLLTERERRQIVVEWNDTRSDVQPYSCLHDWFDAQAAETPYSQAVVMGNEILTYSELSRRSDQLAAYLRAAGVHRNVLVGVYMDRCPEMIAALLGILKAGGAYLPLDPAFPYERLTFMLEDSQAPFVITQQSLVRELAGLQARVFCIDSDWPRLAELPCSAESRGASPDDLAYLIYTSGSTGKPKGTEIPHSAVVNLLRSMQKEPGLEPSDTLLSVTTLSFDIAALELFLPLVTGARVVLASRKATLDPHELATLLDRSQATVMQATPSTWRMLIDSNWPGQPDLKILCGGETLPRELAAELCRRSGSLWNMYGPTETTIWSALHRVEPGEDPILVGRPIDNTRMYILDQQLQPVPVGVAGELYIAGAGLARGYWKRPELTKERFIPEILIDSARSRMYRTGDLARYHANGAIEILSRVDNQVKIRGHRIELGEIEAVMGQHPAVRQAIVVARGNSADRKLVAYLIADGAQLPGPELRSWMLTKLPDHMVPSAFAYLDSFPLTPNGKIDRTALPEAALGGAERDGTYVAPRTQLEENISGIFADLLNINDPSVHDNFFDLGGHSLLLVKVHDRLRRELGASLSVIDLFQYPTIESLAGFLNQGDAL